MNAVLETIAKRCSCRAYTSEPLSEAEVNALALAAVSAPSGMNIQPWRVSIVNDPALMAELEAEAMKALSQDKHSYDRVMGRGGKIYYNAPCMFIVAADMSKKFAIMDSGILCENITLAAESMGLASVICGMGRFVFATDPEKYKKRLGIPDGYEFVMSVLVGKAAAEFKPHEPDMGKIHFVK